VNLTRLSKNNFYLEVVRVTWKFRNICTISSLKDRKQSCLWDLTEEFISSSFWGVAKNCAFKLVYA
jgi:hypothetical protein